MIRYALFCALAALLGLGCVTTAATTDPKAGAPPPLTNEQIIELADTQAREALARKVAALEAKLVEARGSLNGAREEEQRLKAALAAATAVVKTAEANVKTAEAAVAAAKGQASCTADKVPKK